MKRFTYLFVVVLVVAFTSSSWAYPRAVNQLTNGAKDVITSPLHVKDNVMTETKDKSFRAYPFALVGGLLKGTFYMGKQVVDGTKAIVTSPLELTK